ncbi:MAG: DUF4325 domain-containing protein [Ignavibacteriales bacterium]|nr:DUF4325 domain-containing protein [Ignavibacteriales bacterium]
MKTNKELFTLKKYGENFGPRVLGIRIKDDIINILQKSSSISIIIDLTDVKVLSTGFAKELFGGLLEELGDEFKEKIKFRFGNNRELLLSSIFRAMN